jgi:Lanthionine synthetase C-like protein
VALFSPEQHEPLTDRAWDERRVRAAIAAIVDDAERAYDEAGLWTLHPLDWDDDEDAGRSYAGIYLGAAGVIWALAELGSQRDFAAIAAGLDDRYLVRPDYGPPAPGLWLGRAGILAVAERLAPDAARRDLLHTLLDENVENPAVEVMWGAPGSMLVAAALLDRTGEQRFGAVWRRLANAVWDGWAQDEQLGCRIWTQDLYGSVTQFVGPAHGMAGCVAALAQRPDLLGAERAGELERDAVRAVTAIAVVEDGRANWEPILGAGLEARGPSEIRTQWCHGAPGIVATLGGMAPDDEAFTQLLVAGGELTWEAGPLAKGPTLCHGTAGNGLAFLALLERTGDERWLERARRFGMHAADQVEQARAEYGRGRHSLWTGDLGVALYLRSCIDPISPVGIDIGCW